jgi:hypothetical protein
MKISICCGKNNKQTEEQVKKDVKKMNTTLSDELKTQGIKYVLQ